MYLAVSMLAAGPISSAAAPANSVAAVAFSSPQKKGDPLWDPYTQNKPEVIQAAGYLAWNDFMFGKHRTSSIADKLGGMTIRWLETENFKIGCELPDCPPPYLKAEKARFAEECKRLKKRLPKLPKKVKKMDPWLRTHLFAQRAEDQYAQFLADFQIDPDKCEAEFGGRWLGRKQKFMILLVDKEDTLARYTGNYTDQSSRMSAMHHFKESDAFFFGLSFETYADSDQVDTDFYSSFAGGLYEAFLQAYRSPFQLPWWFSQGMGNLKSRSISPRMDIYGNIKGHVTFEGWWRWQDRVQAHVRWDLYRPFPECSTLKFDSKDLDVVDYMMMWSWAEYLQALPDKQLLDFLNRMKQPMNWQGDATYQERVLEHSRSAMLLTFKQTPEQFEEAWRAWVLKRGKAKKR